MDDDPAVSNFPHMPDRGSPMKHRHPIRASQLPSRLRRIPVLLLLVLPLVGACYSYTQVGVDSVAPGEAVRLRMFDQAVDRLPAQLERRTQIEGTIVDIDGGRLDLLPELGSATTDPVALAVPDIEAISRRELNQTRTWIAVAIGAALGVGLLLSIEGEPAATSGGPITEFMTGWTLWRGR